VSTTAKTDPLALAERRAARLARIVEAYEVGEEGAPDSSVPGAARVVYYHHRDKNGAPIMSRHPRYVLVTQYGDKGNYRLYLANDLANVEQVARLAVCEDESISCYFDLDQLAGEEPSINDGDVVRWAPDDVFYDYRVERIDEELIEGEVTRYLCLVEQGRETKGWDDYDHRVRESDDVEVVERDWPDERMPVRYGLARVVVSVIFNTVPSP
jgi:hypothetical protein